MHYRVGSLNGRDVYWNPIYDYSIETDHQYLVDLTDLSQVAWFDKDGDLEKIVEDLHVSNSKLAEAMVESLYDHILDAVEDQGFAAECEEEKCATLREGSSVDEAEEVYQRSAMESARAQYAVDRPYLRMAKDRGVHIETQAECEAYKRAIMREWCVR